MFIFTASTRGRKQKTCSVNLTRIQVDSQGAIPKHSLNPQIWQHAVARFHAKPVAKQHLWYHSSKGLCPTLLKFDHQNVTAFSVSGQSRMDLTWHVRRSGCESAYRSRTARKLGRLLQTSKCLIVPDPSTLGAKELGQPAAEVQQFHAHLISKWWWWWWWWLMNDEWWLMIDDRW